MKKRLEHTVSEALHQCSTDGGICIAAMMGLLVNPAKQKRGLPEDRLS
ncbi:MAG: hypothetical protein PHG00_12420 [Methylococcales bacterium]|nr:hypothetical protein [Methylococcales bacterium]